MSNEEYQTLNDLLIKYRGNIDPDFDELKNDVDFVIINLRTTALANNKYFMKETA